MTIHLEAKNATEERLKQYLEGLDDEVLAAKINDGVWITKDGKRYLNKKDLAGFMRFATEETRKQAEKGASSACVEDAVVFGWLTHYFYEDAIEGTLYNEDGTPYKAAKPTERIVKVPSKKKATETEHGGQENLLAFIPAVEHRAEEDDEEDTVPAVEADADNEEEELESVEEETLTVDEAPPSPLYAKYKAVQDKYPEYPLVYRVGDFYEIMGRYAEELAPVLGLTLVSRSIGNGERVPMIGFPFHKSEVYVDILYKTRTVVVVDSNGEPFIFEREKPEAPPEPDSCIVDPRTGEVKEAAPAANDDAAELIADLTGRFGEVLDLR